MKIYRVMALAQVASVAVLICAQESRRTGLISSEAAACAGYTLLAPLNSTVTYLVDMQGRPVHSWKSEYTPGQAAYLLPNGHLLRAAHEPDSHGFRGGGIGGRIEEFDWEGNLVWHFVLADETRCQHHDIEPMPNGNILLIAWERKSREEAIDAGRSHDLLFGDEIWPDCIIEVKPQPKEGAEIVWEWHAWDHLVQEYDEEKPSFGVPAEHPELIDLNFGGMEGPFSGAEVQRLRSLGYIGGDDDPDHGRDVRRAPDHRGGLDGPPGSRADWLHTNSVDYNAGLDQIILSVHGFNEIWIIDHSTTTAEAAGHSGGRRGRGGDLLYRWGNPQSYFAGGPEDQRLFGQHDACWIPDKFPGAGNILVFNNGRGRSGGNFSTVEELVLPRIGNAGYALDDERVFLPAQISWTYGKEPSQRFFSGHISGAQRLPNGNTLVCAGEQARLMEVTRSGEIVWEYVSAFPGDRRPGGGSPGGFRRPRGPRFRTPEGAPDSQPPQERRGRFSERGPIPGGGPAGGGLFRATRIMPDDLALSGRSLSPIAETAETRETPGGARVPDSGSQARESEGEARIP